MLLKAELAGWKEAGANVVCPPAASSAAPQDEIFADLLPILVLGCGWGMGGHGAEHLRRDGGELLLSTLSG